MMHAYRERVSAAIHDLQQGKMVILVDNPDRENEGDIIFPAEIVTPEIVNFMIRHCSGIICLSLTESKANQLGLSYMVPPHEYTGATSSVNGRVNGHGTTRFTPSFTLSIEAKSGVTTGVSALDRAHTILTAVKENACADDVIKPGHIFPLLARSGGVLERAGHTEGSVDLVRMAGFKPAAILCEVMNPDGTMASGDGLQAFANEHQIKMLSIEDLIAYRLSHENLIAEEAKAQLPLQKYGIFEMTVVKEKLTHTEHIVLEKKSLSSPSNSLLVRIHSACITGDLFGSLRCDCHHQLHYSLKRIGEEGGLLIYLNQEGRGIGLFNKIKAYALQEQGLDTVEANLELGLPSDSRKYHIAANILRNRDVTQVRLLTNNPDKINDLKKFSLLEIAQETMPVFCHERNKHYLHTKQTKLNHLMNAKGLTL